MKKRISLLAALSLFLPVIVQAGASGTVFLDVTVPASVAPNTAPPGLSLSKIQGSYSWNTSYVQGGVGGKDENDTAFFIKTENYQGQKVGTDPGGDPFLGIAIPAKAMTTTYEGSLMGPSDGSASLVSAAINGTLCDLFKLNNNGAILLNGVEAGRWETGKWYKFAAVLYQGTNRGDFYLNGVKLLENAAIPNVDVINNFTRYKAATVTATASAASPQSNLGGFDNMRWYTGPYDPSGDTVSISSNVFDIKASAKTIGISSAMTQQEFTAGITGSRVKVYTDQSLAQPAAQVTEGCVAVALSSSGEVLDYYHVLDTYLESSYTIDEAAQTISGILQGTPVQTVLNNISTHSAKSILYASGETASAATPVSNGMVLRLESSLGYLRKFTIKTLTEVNDTFDGWPSKRYTPSNSGELYQDMPIYASGGFPPAETANSAWFQMVSDAPGRSGKTLKFFSNGITADDVAGGFRHFAVIHTVPGNAYNGVFVTDVSIRPEDTYAANTIVTKYMPTGGGETKFANIIELTKDGNVTLYGKNVARYQPQEWHRYTVVTDLPAHTATLYIDGELAGTNTTLSSDIAYFTQFRMQHQLSHGNQRTVYFDDFSIYKLFSADSFSTTDISARLESSVYRVSMGAAPRISNIPSGIKTDVFKTNLLAENSNVVLNVYGPDLGNPVSNTTLNKDMLVKAQSPDGRTTQIYQLTLGSVFNLFEDFESYPTGHLTASDNWIINEKAETGGSVDIVANPSGSGKVYRNTVRYVQNSNNYHDSYIETYPKGVGGDVYMSMKVWNAAPTAGSLNVGLRDAVNELEKGNFSLFTLAGGKINYLPNFLSVSESMPSGWLNISVKLNGESGKIEIYRDQVKKAEVADYKAYGQLAAFAINNFKLRFQGSVSSSSADAVFYVDDVRFHPNTSLHSNLVINPPSLYSVINGKDVQISSLDDGSLKVKTAVSNLFSNNQTAQLIVSHRRNGVLQNTFSSSLSTIAANATNVLETAFTLQNLGETDSISVFLFDSLTGMQPLQPMTTFLKPVLSTPTSAQLQNLYQQKLGTGNVHPRVMATADDFARIRSERNTSATVSKWAGNVISTADNICANLTLDSANQSSSYYIGYMFSEGERLLMMSRRVKDFATTLGMAYQLTCDIKYVNTLWTMLERAGKPDTANPQAPGQFPDWHPVHFLDTAEMTAGFAIGYDWCYDALTDAQRAYIERSIVDYGLNVGMSAYNGESIPGGSWWAKGNNNWNVVCNGGLTLGAIAVADKNPAFSFKIVENAIGGLQYMLPYFAPDGAWYEGAGYWQYTIQYLAKMLSTLDSSMGTDFGILRVQGIDKTGEFALHFDGPTGVNNFHDAGSGHLSASELFWLSNVLGKPMLTSARLNQMQTYNNKGGALDLLWYDSSIASTDFTLPKTAYFRGTEAVTMRGEWGSAASPWLSFHAGKANDNHSHLDCGTFVFDSMNVRWAMDLGGDDYTLPGYFGNQRWEYYRLRAEGHNTLVINPGSSGGQDLDADTPITQFVGRDNNPYSILDLSSAYKAQANSVRRGLMMTDGMQGMLVRDEMDLKSNATVYWFMHTSANATVNADNTVTLEKNNKKMKLRFVTDAPNAWISVVDAKPLPVIDGEVSSSGYPNDPNQSPNNGVRKVMIKLKGSGKINLSVQLLPEGQTSQANLNLPLNQWN